MSDDPRGTIRTWCLVFTPIGWVLAIGYGLGRLLAEGILRLRRDPRGRL